MKNKDALNSTALLGHCLSPQAQQGVGEALGRSLRGTSDLYVITGTLAGKAKILTASSTEVPMSW